MTATSNFSPAIAPVLLLRLSQGTPSAAFTRSECSEYRSSTPARSSVANATDAAPGPSLRGGRGFTLLEILLVMTLIALAALAVVPNIGELDARDFDVQARQAVALLNHARRTAVVSGTPASATFYDAVAESADLPQAARNSVGSWYGGAIALSYQDSSEREVEFERLVEFSFYPEGGSSGGTLTLSANSRRIAIEVDPFTGRIHPEANDE